MIKQIPMGGINMLQYRIYTQNYRLKWIKQACNELFEGYTIYYTDGYWKRIKEKSIVIEILYDERHFRYIELKIRTLVSMLKGYGKQESVLVTKTRVDLLED